RRAISSAEDLLALVGDKRNLAGDHIDEFVFCGMPVPLTRSGTRRKLQQIDAELGEPAGITETPSHAVTGDSIEGLRIGDSTTLESGLHVDLWHDDLR